MASSGGGSGNLRYSYPGHLQIGSCWVRVSDVEAVGGHLLVYVDLCAQPCCGFGPAPDGPIIAMLAARTDERARTPGVIAWRSPDGARWTRHALRGLAPKDGSGFSLLFAREPGYPSRGLLAFRDGKEQAVLRSRDGLRWQRFGRAPQSVDTYGQLEIASVAGGVVLVGESYEAEPGYGNEMRIWRLERGGVTHQTMVRRPAFANGVLVSDDRILVLGSAWGPGQGPDDEDEESWAWIDRLAGWRTDLGPGARLDRQRRQLSRGRGPARPQRHLARLPPWRLRRVRAATRAGAVGRPDPTAVNRIATPAAGRLTASPSGRRRVPCGIATRGSHETRRSACRGDSLPRLAGPPGRSRWCPLLVSTLVLVVAPPVAARDAALRVEVAEDRQPLPPRRGAS